MLKTEQEAISMILYFYDKPEIQRSIIERISPEFFEDSELKEIVKIFKKAYQEKAVMTLDYLEHNGIKIDKLYFPDSYGITEKTINDKIGFLIEEYQARCLNALWNSKTSNPKEIDNLIQTLQSIQNLNVCSIAKSTDSLFKELKETFYTKNHVNMKFGISALDSDIKIRAGDLIIIGARTGCGKSALALQFARAIARQGRKALYFNLEMSERQVLERIISADRQINLSRLSYAESFIGNDEKEKFESFLQNNDLKNLKFCSGSFDIPRIQLEARRNIPDVIFVDYLQLVKPGGNYRGNRVAEVSEISHKLKALAMDLQIPIIALSQLNRESERKSEPTSSDLRECGDLENDASIVLLLWNDEKDDKAKYIKISKNRQGKCGTYNLYFEGKYMTFSEWKTPSQEEQLNIPFKADGG